MHYSSIINFEVILHEKETQVIPIKRADEASTGFVIYEYYKIQRVGDLRIASSGNWQAALTNRLTLT